MRRAAAATIALTTAGLILAGALAAPRPQQLKATCGPMLSRGEVGERITLR
jgi:hypothetical protein